MAISAEKDKDAAKFKLRDFRNFCEQVYAEYEQELEQQRVALTGLGQGPGIALSTSSVNLSSEVTDTVTDESVTKVTGSVTDESVIEVTGSVTESATVGEPTSVIDVSASAAEPRDNPGRSLPYMGDTSGGIEADTQAVDTPTMGIEHPPTNVTERDEGISTRMLETHEKGDTQ